jgi:hypothetical protein
MLTKTIQKRILALAIIVFSVNANALIIDFTNQLTWGGVDGEQTYSTTDNGVIVTLDTLNSNTSEFSGTMTFNAIGDTAPGSLSLSNGGTLLGQGDGIGVRRIGDSDEINSSAGGSQEFLNITFDEYYRITEVFILDLFNNEVAVFSIDGSTFPYVAIGNEAWGFHEIDVSGTGNTMNLAFWVDPPGPGDDGDNDYALAGLRIAPQSVPEPTTLALLSIGFIGIGAARKLKKH